MEYIAYLSKREDSNYAVRFFDFPECIVVGRTLSEARDHAADELTRHLAQIVHRGGDIPEPSTLDDLAERQLETAGLVVLVAAQPPEKTVRINITARASQMEEIDRMARLSGMTRSAFLVQNAIRGGGLVPKQMLAD